eukprot:4962908-Amphidinium_carterae.1
MTFALGVAQGCVPAFGKYSDAGTFMLAFSAGLVGTTLETPENCREYAEAAFACAAPDVCLAGSAAEYVKCMIRTRRWLASQHGHKT